MFARISDLDRMFDAMSLLRSRFDHVFNDLDRPVRWGNNWAVGSNFPSTNLYDLGDRFELIAELPGISKDDIDIRIQGNYLEISGTRKADHPEGYTVHRAERAATTFSRSFTLPYEVDAAKVNATLKDGLLKMTLPKSEAAKPRQINIQ